MYEGHGGNLAEVQERFGWLPGEILDFSTNINPLGIPGRALKAFQDSFDELETYPDPKNRSLLLKAIRILWMVTALIFLLFFGSVRRLF